VLVVPNEISPQTHAVENPGTGHERHSKALKKDALGTFAKLLSGLLRKTKGDGDGAAEAETEGLVPPEMLAQALKDAAEKKAEFPEIPGEALSADNEKIKHKDKFPLLASVAEEEGESLFPAAEVKKRRAGELSEDGEDTGVSLFAAVPEVSPQEMAVSEEPLPHGAALEEGADFSEQAELSRFSGAESLQRDNHLAGESETAGMEDGSAAFQFSPRAGQNSKVIEKKGVGAAPGETRNSKKNRERFTLDVQDLRTGGNGVVLTAGQELKPATEAGEGRVTDMVVELRSGGRNREQAEFGREKTASQAFGDILARELHQNLNGDIVRQASIMVRDGESGTIRLSLRPESLGTVKIRLEMAENKITGHILVESTEALRAFEREIHSLEQAFRDSGFDGAHLDMSLAQDGGQRGSPGQWNGDDGRPRFSSLLASSNYDAAVETVSVPDGKGFITGDSGMIRVNMLV
jgi:hypothetical protein